MHIWVVLIVLAGASADAGANAPPANLAVESAVPSPTDDQQSVVRVVGISGQPIRLKNEDPPKPLLEQPQAISSLVSVFALVVTAIFGILNLKHSQKVLERSDENNRRTLLLRSREEESKRLQKALTDFLLPLQHLLATSKTLYGDFKGSRGDDFRTLTFLVANRAVERKGLSPNEEQLLLQILEISKMVEALIHEEYYLVGNKTLQDTLSQLAAHYRLMRLAYDGKLELDPERSFKNQVFPTRIGELLEKEIADTDQKIRDIQAISVP